MHVYRTYEYDRPQKWISFADIAVCITKTCIKFFDPPQIPLLYCKTGVNRGTHYFFLFLLKNIVCGYSLEPPRRGGSNEYPQSNFWAEIWKLSEFLTENFQFLEAKFSIYSNRRVFVMGIAITSLGRRGANCFSFRWFVKCVMSIIVCSLCLLVSLVGYVLCLCIFLDISLIKLRKHAYSNILKISPPKNEFPNKYSDIFHISAKKHRLWVLVRTASASAKKEIRKITYTL